MLPNIVLLGMLAISAYKDWKEKAVYVYILLGTGIIGLVFHMVYQNRSISDILGGAAIGVFVLLMGWASREGIGYGDGLTLVISGIFLGFERNLQLLVIALCFSTLFALYLLIVKKKARSYRIPFLPFLLAAYLLVLQ